MSYDEDPLEKVSKGAMKGILEHYESKIISWAKGARSRELAFIGDPETIDDARKQRETGEWDLFTGYVTNRTFRVLFQMGLTLRHLEKENKKGSLIIYENAYTKYIPKRDCT